MAEGSATVSYFSEILGTDLTIVDVGIDGPSISELEKTKFKWPFLDRRVAQGTGDITIEAAMSEEQVAEAISVGYNMVEESPRPDILVLGDMGIGNTTACGAILAARFSVSPNLTTGNGSGVFGHQLEKKIACVTAATDRFREAGRQGTPLDILRELGGLEIAAIVGALIGAAAHRVPVVLDGLIVSTAYSIASSLVRGMDHLCLSGTRSADAGYNILEQQLALRPILDLGMRLGEGTAALLCFPLLKTASQQLRASATREDLLRES
jgi:nicotinate-nucleotide--dimethylbenzimidazole phosphoribosyltransferase